MEVSHMTHVTWPMSQDPCHKTHVGKSRVSRMKRTEEMIGRKELKCKMNLRKAQ